VTVRKAASAQLERMLAAHPTKMLDLTKIRLLNRELQHLLVSSLPTRSANILDRGEDTIHDLATRVGVLDARPRDRRARQPLGD
jgi:hypothetical protein